MTVHMSVSCTMLHDNGGADCSHVKFQSNAANVEKAPNAFLMPEYYMGSHSFV